VKSTIQLCLSNSILLNVSGEATTKALWDKLGTLYQSKSLVNKLFLLSCGRSCTCYLFNQSPSSKLDEKTPREVCTGEKPFFTHLRVLGCETYVHVPKENMSKLDKNDEKCIFIGYKYGMKGYKLWNPKNKKVVYRRDVVFREIKYVFKQEVLPRKEEPEKIEFELKDGESDSTEEHESEEEDPHTLVLRRLVQERRKPKRYNPPYFLQIFLCLLLMMILELLGRQWIQRMKNYGKRSWLNKWYPWTRMRLGIYWSC
jgi:hypothetical protein